MEIQVIRIGNSKETRLTKSILKKYNITDKMEIILEEDQIVIKPKIIPQLGWEEAFRKMNGNGDDKFLIDDIFKKENLPKSD